MSNGERKVTGTPEKKKAKKTSKVFSHGNRLTKTLWTISSREAGPGGKKWNCPNPGKL